MKIHSHAAIVVLVCSLGGLLLASGLAIAHWDIQKSMRESGLESDALRDVQHAEILTRQWLVSVDLVFGGGQTYLAEGANEQATELGKLLADIKSDPLADGCLQQIDVALEGVEKTRALTETAAILAGEDRDDQLQDLLSEVDSQTLAVVDAIEESHNTMQERSNQNARALEAQREWVVWFAGFAALTYVLLVVGIWRWQTVTMVRPISRLTAAAAQRDSDEAVFDYDGNGPTEVQTLHGSLHDFASRLHDARDRAEEARKESEERAVELKETLDDLHQTQAQLLQSEKMASIGQLAAGVAHEINNPIGYVSSNLGVLRDYVQDFQEVLGAYERLTAAVENDRTTFSEKFNEVKALRDEVDLDGIREDLDDVLTESVDGIKRVRDIVADLKDFSHIDKPELEHVDLNLLLDKTVNVAANEIKYTAVVEKEFAELPPVRCFGGKLGQVFLNLIINASHTTKEMGTITLRTGVEDTGCGIPEENLNRIFDPFFTTKPVGTGTGLGLNLAYNIVNSHDGEISVRSTVGKGTCFRIELPIVGPTEEIEKAGDPVSASTAAL